MAALRLTSPLKTISGFPATMAVALGAAERIFEVLDEPPTEVDQPGEGEARFEREIVFDRVGFRYGDGDPVLERHLAHDSQGQGGRARRSLRRGQDDTRRPAPPLPRSDRGSDPAGRRAAHPPQAPLAPRADGRGEPGYRAAQRHRARQHRLRLSRRHPRAGRGRGRGGERGRVHPSSSPRASTPSWASGAPVCPAASASGSPSPGRCCATRRS